jgi:hypothetical protein
MMTPLKNRLRGIACIGIFLASINSIAGPQQTPKITLPDGATLEFYSISMGERLEKSLGIEECLEIRYAHAPLPEWHSVTGTVMSHRETHSTSPVQIRFRYSQPAEWKWDVYLVDGQGIESKAREFARSDHDQSGRKFEGPNKGWFWIDAYCSRRDFYHLRIRPHQMEYDPYDIPSLPLVAQLKIKNTVKVDSAPERWSSAPVVAKQGQVELLMKSFIRRRQPKVDAAERTSGEFEERHPFKGEMPYVPDTDSMTIWDQSGNMMHFNGPVYPAVNGFKLWDRDTFMSDDRFYRVKVDLFRRPTIPELFKSSEVFHFSHITAPGHEAVNTVSTLVVGGRKLTLERVNPTPQGRSGLVLTGDLPRLGERLVLVDAIDDHGRRLAGLEAQSGAMILRESAIGIEDQPATGVVFPFELPQDAAWLSVDFAFDKATTFEFKVAPKFVD